MKKIYTLTILILASLFLVNCPDKAEDPIPKIGTLFILSGIRPASGGGGGGTTNSPPSITESSTTTEVVAGTSFTVNSVSVFSNSSTATSSFKIVMSIDSNLDSTDTEVGTLISSSPTSYTVDVPASLVPATSSLPVRYYYGLIPRLGSSTINTVIVFPANSLSVAGTRADFSPAAISLTATNTQAFIKYGLSAGITKFTTSAYQVTGGLNVSLALVQISPSISIVSNSTINANGVDAFEFNSYGATIPSFTTYYLRIASVAGTVGSFKPNLFSDAGGVPLILFGVSCNGGTGNFLNRCTTYSTDFSPTPGSNANCIALQGAGSTFSAGACTSTNRVRRCYSNPLFNNGYGVISFYTPETVGTADAVCGADISGN
jgi:hypothetical protein